MAKDIKIGKKYIVTSNYAKFPKGTVVRAIENHFNDEVSTAFTDKLDKEAEVDWSDWSDWYFIDNTYVKRIKKPKTATNIGTVAPVAARQWPLSQYIDSVGEEFIVKNSSYFPKGTKVVRIKGTRDYDDSSSNNSVLYGRADQVWDLDVVYNQGSVSYAYYMYDIAVEPVKNPKTQRISALQSSTDKRKPFIALAEFAVTNKFYKLSEREIEALIPVQLRKAYSVVKAADVFKAVNIKSYLQGLRVVQKQEYAELRKAISNV